MSIEALQILALGIAILIAMSSIDDLAVDAWFWVREIYRAIAIRPRHPPLPHSALLEKPEQRLAIVIPAWREQDVIAAMIENTISTANYNDYLIFVGTYPNDAATIAEVERARRRHRRVVRVETPHPGPTNKADCLNAILEAVFAEEAASGRPFAGVALHDPEDVVHPLELKFFNYLLPRKDLIQLPVVSMGRRLRDLVAGAYMDEFAEWHAKELVVRESFAHAVPSAGVGVCFSRAAIETLRTDGDVFNTRTLTEDYDIAARLAKAGKVSIIARYPVEFRIRRPAFFGLGRAGAATLRMPLCVREYFPNTFRAAYRQKARWTIGVALQGWAQLGWSRSMRVNYFLLRDRKALITPVLVMLAYLVVLTFLALALIYGPGRIAFPETWRTLAAWVVGFDLVALGLRVVQRMYFVNRLYGWAHAIASAPRMVVASVLNFAATARALRIFGAYLITRKPIAWGKASHAFPTSDTLTLDRRRLGEILMSWEAVSEAHLKDALREQRQSQRPLGRILLSHGWLDEETLAEAVAIQAELPRAAVAPEVVAQHRGVLPGGLCVRIAAAPIGRTASGAPILAVARPLSNEHRAEVIRATGYRPVERIVRESEIAVGLRTVSRAGWPEGQESPPLLGDILIESGGVSQTDFDAALAEYEPERDGRIGEHLLRSGVVTDVALAAAIFAQSRWGRGSGLRP
ncbi:glycosyl transferase family protein [Phenylobacterium sp.]|uniref:glycosyl transferase family protein n=1 Tax=Phenylobacterium sp. TaxID=1871053 RepID=UPI0035652B6C